MTSLDSYNFENMGSGTSIQELQEKNDNNSQQSYNYPVYPNDNIQNYNPSVYSNENSQDYNPSLYSNEIPQNINYDDNINIIADSIIPNNDIKEQDNIKYIAQEILLIVLLYVLLSQPYIIKFFSQFIKMIIPNKEGVSLTGLVIYGLILGFCFVLLRKYTLPLF